MIRNVMLEDAAEIAVIYNHYILNSVVTFEEIEIQKEEIQKRIKAVIPKYPWLVYVRNSQVVGYAYASEWKSRSAYRNTVESAIYVKHGETGKGIGTALYKKLIEELSKRNFHTVLGGIALPNVTSIRLHEKLGFQKAGQLNEVGCKFGNWIDVGYWELII